MLSKLRIYSIIFSIAYWMLVGFYFVAIRFVGLGDYAPPDLDYGTLAEYAGIVGFVIGLLFGLFPISKVLRLKKRRYFLCVVLISK